MRRGAAHGSIKLVAWSGFSCGARVAGMRRIAAPVPWESALPPPSSQAFASLGRALGEASAGLDTGPAAFAECFVARGQVEAIVRSCGYDMSIHAFGGLAVMGFLEVGGDVDFVGICDVEPSAEEAGDVVLRITREMRRMGLKAMAVPRARVPVVKVDRVSRVPPGTHPDRLSSNVVFHFSRPLTAEEGSLVGPHLEAQFGALTCELGFGNRQSATASFPSTDAAVHACASFKSFGGVEVPLRLPADLQHSPELYRYPFDVCLSSMGLRNSTLLGEHLAGYSYSRHLLLMVKRWGRACGVVNTLDGLLASYALTVMVSHFLMVLEVVPPVDPQRLSGEAELLPKELPYRSLPAAFPERDQDGEASRLGYLFAAFFEYYASVFRYDSEVICTTHKRVPKKILKWDRPEVTGRPPFFHLAIKDPYGLDNVARNVDSVCTQYIRDCFRLAADAVRRHVTGGEDAVTTETPGVPAGGHPSSLSLSWLEEFIRNPSKPEQPPVPLFLRGGSAAVGVSSSSGVAPGDSAMYLAQKMEFQRRRDHVNTFGERAASRQSRNSAATNVAHRMTSWLRSDMETK